MEDDHDHMHIHIYMMCWLLLITLPHSHCETGATFDYSVCKKHSYNCGNLSNIFYPFWGHNRSSECGSGDPFKLTCNHDHNTTSIQIASENFTVKEINNTAHTMKLVPADTVTNLCSPQSENGNESHTGLFQDSPSVQKITIFYYCPCIRTFSYGHFMCGDDITYYALDYDRLFVDYPQLLSCKRSLHTWSDAQLNFSGGILALEKVLNEGFVVNYNVSRVCERCLGSEGRCWRDDIEKHVVNSCYYCQNGSHGLHCSPSPLKTTTSSAAIATVLICVAIFCLRYKSSIMQGHFGLTSKSNRNIEAFLKNHGAQTLKRYKFSEVKKMTNSFKVKLGEGSFGAVYKGEILNGCPVAIKKLSASKGNGEDFINEVASISRTSHVNVVQLLGFCLEGSNKALIYEYMSNGSLDKFIYNKGVKAIPSLGWDNLCQIAKGIAQGLEYLHKGCNTRILHFDIKPHNILLDENFCPKISDFGLAKLCPMKESTIFMSDQRGTIGYKAPEVWNRHLGGVSHKSDVYSYGMMLLEMVGGRRNINAEANHRSEIYFPHWAYNRLKQGRELRADWVITTEEQEIARRMTIVGLWCVQTIPHDRPTMSRVIDMLEANMNSLEMPPKPDHSSPIS
ncbi:LEAF RUST 10 DISEASE-RESISTANCE LOCUS RECEPTOR-LIKE PROTEIN KINASE-like 2.3 [Vigna radiata var. radiata]|uniref:non-specific serine/threonine protein kinase n=1 Tax=Vigna radiata var. radiata TaxID=3916 RepID=A0A1S3TKU2_VIGRR|nr:LEAF RUST 10 DISEASE-RESISTANCE LOCUS RECEPTOR-LIKE PROTEIN KINASE-like 2.3 [Vigna radiata var. radiata]